MWLWAVGYNLWAMGYNLWAVGYYLWAVGSCYMMHVLMVVGMYVFDEVGVHVPMGLCASPSGVVCAMLT